MTPPTPKDVIAWKVEQSGDWTVVFDADKAAQYEVDSTVTPLSPAEMATVYNEMARELTEHREKCAAYYGDAVGWELQASTLRAERDAAVQRLAAVERVIAIVREEAQTTIDQYNTNGPEWTSRTSGEEYYSAGYVLGKAQAILDAALTPTRQAAVTHNCGAQGFDPWKGDKCLGCEAAKSTTPTRGPQDA